jgi:hypothetical protein
MGSSSVRAAGSWIPIHQSAAPTATPSARPSANALNPLGYFFLLGMITMTISVKMLKNGPSIPQPNGLRPFTPAMTTHTIAAAA